MQTVYEIIEEGCAFSKVVAVSAEEALTKAIKDARFAACDYNCAQGDELDLQWFAVNVDDRTDRASRRFTATAGK